MVSPAVKEATRRLVLADSTFDTCAVMDILLRVDVVFGTVSYTHLDVYKRQSGYCASDLNYFRTLCVAVGMSAYV